MRVWLLISLFAVTASPLVAGPHDQAVFDLDAKAPFTPTKNMGLCGPGSYDPNAQGTPCFDYNVVRPIHESPGPIVYLVVAQLGSVGILAASCGIDYDGGPGTGLDPRFVSWTGCTDGAEYTSEGPNGDWPNPGAGIRVTWLTCQNQDIPPNGVHAVLGCFYLYAYSGALLEVTPNNNLDSGPEAAVTSCFGGTTDLLDVLPEPYVWNLFAKVQFGGFDRAWNSCFDLDAKQTTWGRLKRQYGP